MMYISFNLLLPVFLLVLALGIFLTLKAHKTAWKIVGWVLVATMGLFLLLLSGALSRAYCS